MFPFNGFVWAITAVQLFLMPIVFQWIAKLEQCIGSDGSRYWSRLPNSVWYCVATLLGENVSKKASKQKAWAIRYTYKHYCKMNICIYSVTETRVVSLAWLLFTLIITSAYSGNLRAYLLKPKMHPAVETISDIVSSGLPWSMVLWGDDLGVSLSQAKDPDMKTFWEKMRSEEYSNFPYETVRDQINVLALLGLTFSTRASRSMNLKVVVVVVVVVVVLVVLGTH